MKGKGYLRVEGDLDVQWMSGVALGDTTPNGTEQPPGHKNWLPAGQLQLARTQFCFQLINVQARGIHAWQNHPEWSSAPKYPTLC